MITEEERQSIINEAVEKALLVLPEVVGNLILTQAQQVKMNREFYEKHPELAANKDLVASIVERVDGDNPGLGYKDVLEKALPLIKERMKLVTPLSLKVPSKPIRNLSSLSDHGEL